MTGTITYPYEDEELGLEAEFEIDYDATPERPGEKWDKYGDPGNPPEPAEMEITEVRICGEYDLSAPDLVKLRARGSAWIYGKGYDDVCQDCWEDVEEQLEDHR